MRTPLVLLLLVSTFATGCGQLTCPLLGLFAGRFAGDREGELTIDVMENPDDPDKADTEIRLTAPPLDIFGSAVIDCEDGMLSTRLEMNEDGTAIDFGEFSGLLGKDGLGDGEWSFNSGEMGTWELDREED